MNPPLCGIPIRRPTSVCATPERVPSLPVNADTRARTVRRARAPASRRGARNARAQSRAAKPAPRSGRSAALLRYAAICFLVAAIAGVRGFGMLGGGGASEVAVPAGFAMAAQVICGVFLLGSMGLFLAAVRRR